MTRTHLHEWADKLAAENSLLEIKEEIYRGHYYTKDHVRNVIFSVIYKKKPAILKIWDDPRHSLEPLSLEAFNKNNKSDSVVAPHLITYDLESPYKGWMIMDPLPSDGAFFSHPLSAEGREEILRVYLEYKKNWPTTPLREPLLWEDIPAVDFHMIRISRWFEVGQSQDAKLVLGGYEPALKSDEFLPRWKKGMAFLRERYADRPMEWSYGHFKGAEVYKTELSKKYYLIDFAHTKMYPVGYEFGFLVWADQFMTMSKETQYQTWRDAIFGWIDAYAPIAEELGIDDFASLAPAALVERCFGTILADVAGSEMEIDEKRHRINLLYQLMDELTEQT